LLPGFNVYIRTVGDEKEAAMALIDRGDFVFQSDSIARFWEAVVMTWIPIIKGGAVEIHQPGALAVASGSARSPEMSESETT